jgi:hypothetical protein
MADVIRLKMDCHEKFVLLMLANYCDAEGGSCFPSVSRLAGDTGMSESSVKRALRNLRDYSGLIQVTPGGGAKSNRYQLATALITQLGMAATQVSLTPVGVDPGQADPPPRSQRPPTPVTLTHDPVIDPIKDPIRESHREIATKDGLNCQEEWQKYQDWLAATGTKHKDLEAGFRNWLRKASQFRPKQDKREMVAEAIWGDRAPSRQRLKTIDEMFSEPAVEGKYERLS